MDRDVQLEIPPVWDRIALSPLCGTVLVVGAPDTGKSTFARHLYRRLCAQHERVAFVDGDVGQSTLGPPATMTLAFGVPGDEAFPPGGPRFRVFVGDISPRRHMLPMLVGAYRLVQKARQEGATAIVFDTTGLVNPADGGGALKRSKVDLLQPTVVVGIQRGSELEHLLLPLRRSHRVRVIDLPVSHGARCRDVRVRREHRRTRFRAYFERARTLELAWRGLAVFPAPVFTPHRLVALVDVYGFALALGIVVASHVARGMLTLYTPLPSPAGVDAICLGDLALDPHTFWESRLP